MSDLPILSYCRPESVEEVLHELQRRGARIYAGGTDLLVALRLRHASVRTVRVLVDIKGVGDARGISDLGADIRIGALTTAAELMAHPVIKRHARALVEAAADTSAPQLRARGTVGGNVSSVHPAADMTTALLALGATVELATASPRVTIRQVPLAQLFTRRGARPNGKHFIVAVRIPKCGQSAFEKLGTRHVFSRSVVAVAVAIRDGSHCVAIGGIGAHPFVARRVSASLDARVAISSALEAEYGAAALPASPSSPLDLAEALIERARLRASRARSRGEA
ncbi:MAG: FAD binding domain-containing protein [Gemmatimonas sp.]